MSLNSFINFLMNSSTLANKGLALAQKPKYYYNEHQRKITLCFVLLMILV